MQCHPWHNKRGDGGSCVGTGIENPGGQSPFLSREPFRYSFDCAWEVSRLSEAECEANDPEAERAVHKSMGHCGNAPNADCQRVARARSNPVDQGSHNE